MPNKKINHGILKLYHSKDINEVINYYQPMMDKRLVKPRSEIGHGIKIGDLVGFKTEHNTDNHPKVRPDEPRIAPANDKPQFKSSGHTELDNHFIFGQSNNERKDASEITQN